ncbi:MAG TPA: dual specificity protein phosphatase family protein [Kofleriaceae bacterium]|nr:dual specificity protein phosphatase family protein [Kofleriaceae bacterium]
MLIPPLIAIVGFALALIAKSWLLVWPATVLLALWIVYLVEAPRALGKRADGTMAWLAWAVWGPVFLYQWISHEVVRRWSGEPVATEVAPGVWVARRPRADELPSEIAIVVDLCAEFPAARAVRAHPRYLAVPTLDARCPRPAELARIADTVIAAGGPAFIHCALGHGRSATVAAAVMIKRGDATLDNVEAKLRALRPKIGLNARQRAALAAAISR